MFKRAVLFLERAEVGLIVTAYSILCILIMAEIVLRTGFQTGIYWLEECGRYILLTMTFIGASIAVSRGGHPQMEAILLAIPAGLSRLLKIVGHLICSITTGLLGLYAVKQVQHMIPIGMRASTLPIPIWVVYLAFPSSLMGMCMRFLLLAAHEAKTDYKAELKAGRPVEGEERC